MHDAIVVGGGLSGLFTASELLGAGVEDVVVLDRSLEPGGVAGTIVRDGYSLEPAAGTVLLPHPHLTPVLTRLGAAVVPGVDAGLRYVFTRDRLVSLPTSPLIAFAPLVPWSAKLRAAAEPFIRSRPGDDDESLEAFLQRRTGDGMGAMLAWLAASGVFGADPARLSARAAFPAIVGLEDDAGSIVRGGIRRLRSRPRGVGRPTSHVPVGGMATLAATGAARLGPRWRGGMEVAAVRRSGQGWEVDAGDETLRARHLVLACRPPIAGALLGGALARVLARAVTAPVVVVGVGGDRDALPLPPGFGALIARDAGAVTLGILFESSYAPDRAPEGHALAKVIAGGATHPEVASWPEERIVATLIADVSRVLGHRVDPSFLEVVRHQDGIPQYEIGHLGWLAEVDALVAGESGLHLTGWGYRGVGVAHVAGDATRVARRIAGAASLARKPRPGHESGSTGSAW